MDAPERAVRHVAWDHVPDGGMIDERGALAFSERMDEHPERRDEVGGLTEVPVPDPIPAGEGGYPQHDALVADAVVVRHGAGEVVIHAVELAVRGRVLTRGRNPGRRRVIVEQYVARRHVVLGEGGHAAQ